MIKVWEFINPKWGRVHILLNKSGDLLIEGIPSKEPGKEVKVSKGVKVFDYDKNVIFKLTYGEVFGIWDFISRIMINQMKNHEEDLELTFIRQTEEVSKRLVFKKLKDYGNAIIWFKDKYSLIDIKFPMSLKTLEEMGLVLESYLKNIAVIKGLVGLRKEEI